MICIKKNKIASNKTNLEIMKFYTSQIFIKFSKWKFGPIQKHIKYKNILFLFYLNIDQIFWGTTFVKSTLYKLGRMDFSSNQTQKIKYKNIKKSQIIKSNSISNYLPTTNAYIEGN